MTDKFLVPGLSESLWYAMPTSQHFFTHFQGNALRPLYISKVSGKLHKRYLLGVHEKFCPCLKCFHNVHRDTCSFKLSRQQQLLNMPTNSGLIGTLLEPETSNSPRTKVWSFEQNNISQIHWYLFSHPCRVFPPIFYNMTHDTWSLPWQGVLPDYIAHNRLLFLCKYSCLPSRLMQSHQW